MPDQAYRYDYFEVSFPREWVAHVEIDRPEKLNAFIEVMWQNLGSIFTRLSTDPSVRCIVLSGTGDRAFTAGLDIAAASTSGILAQSQSQRQDEAPLDPARKAASIRRHILEFQACITAIERCEKPVIVLHHGINYGLAIDIAVAADIRLCTSDERTVFCVKEVDVGLAADIGTLSRLGKVVGSESWVREVCYSARVWSAAEAMRVGFVSRVVDGGKDQGVEEALKLAGLISEKSPVAVQGTKHLINYSRDHSVEDGLSYTATWNMAMLQTTDVMHAMTSGLKKTKPRFAKL